VAIAKSATVAATEVGVGVGIDVAAAIAVSVGGATFGPSVTAHATPRTVKRAMTIVAILNRAVTYDGPMSADVATGYILYSILIALTHESSRRTAHGIYRAWMAVGENVSTVPYARRTARRSTSTASSVSSSGVSA